MDLHLINSATYNMQFYLKKNYSYLRDPKLYFKIFALNIYINHVCLYTSLFFIHKPTKHSSNGIAQF